MIKQTTSLDGSAQARGVLSTLSACRAGSQTPTSALNLRLAVIAAEAKSIEAQAWEMRHALRVRRPDYAAVNAMLAQFMYKANSISEAISGLSKDFQDWAASSSVYARILQQSQVLQLFAQDKSERLNTSAAEQGRRILAARATGIALRASMLHRQLSETRLD